MSKIAVIDGNSLVEITPTIIDTADSNKIVGRGTPLHTTVAALGEVIQGKLDYTQLATDVAAKITITLAGTANGSGTGDGNTPDINITTSGA